MTPDPIIPGESSRALRPSVFLSHTIDDKPLADAFSDAFRMVAGHDVRVVYSSDDGPDGVRPGAEWFRWIKERVAEATATYVLLTPWSLAKPWLLWEAGAAAGVAEGSGRGHAWVRPVTFGLRPDEVPDPLRPYQVVRGDSEEGMRKLLADAATLVPADRQASATGAIERALGAFLPRMRELLTRMPVTPSEAAVQEWCSRLEDLVISRRWSESGQMERWVLAAFGRDAATFGQRGGSDIPIDLRIHRRLAELFMSARNFDRARTHFEMCRRVAPRDMLVLRNLGKALVELERHDEAESVLQRMSALDDTSLCHVEAAALASRVYRAMGRLPDAVNVLSRASSLNPGSYYLTNLLALAYLASQQAERAREAARATRGIIASLGEENVWTIGSLATAVLVDEGPAAVTPVLRRLDGLDARLRPTPDQLATVRRGLEEVCDALRLGPAQRQECLQAVQVRTT